MSAGTGVPASGCPFGWYDGTSSHVCRQTVEHEQHKCSYCGAVYDPSLKPTPQPRPRIGYSNLIGY